MSKTNTLRSHCPEHSTYPADKMIPKSVMKRLREKVNVVIAYNGRPFIEFTKRKRDKGKISKFIKAVHNRRSRRFLKMEIRKEVCLYDNN